MKATDLNLSEMPAMTLHGPDGFGMTQYSGDEYALVGGFRDGSSNAGELRLRYTIFSHALIDANGGDFAKGEIGYCVVRVASDDGEDQGDILGLIDIELKPKYRKSGHGKKIVRDIVDTTKSGNLDIHDIQKKAKKFWDKMGVEYSKKQTGSAQNAVLRKQSESLGDFNKDEPMKSTVAVPGYGTMNIDSLMKNVIDQATAMIKQMQQGTQGFRNADYALNRNKVLPTKIAALVQALDDLQAIRAKGGARSRNIQQEAEEQEPLPIDITRIMNTIQEYESKQYIPVEDADIMRRGISALQTGRQSLGAEQMSVLQLLTMLSPE
jgi:GNAT superfamily N-acetyltransferase